MNYEKRRIFFCNITRKKRVTKKQGIDGVGSAARENDNNKEKRKYYAKRVGVKKTKRGLEVIKRNVKEGCKRNRKEQQNDC